MSDDRNMPSKQREFLFVLNSQPTRNCAPEKPVADNVTTLVPSKAGNISSERADILRQRLVNELQEFGC